MGKAVDPALRQLLKRGGDFDPVTGRDLVAEAAKEHGLAWCVADCDKAPATPRARPINSAAKTRGSRIFQMIS